MNTSLKSGSTSRRIIVGVGAGIAAYKIPALVRHFVKAGDSVRVIPTQASLNFVGAATWQALSGEPIQTSVFDEDAGVGHVEAARGVDLIVIAPATADLIARIRAGLASDMLTSTVLAAACPVLVVPAMHTAMWENPATKDNIKVLKERGIHVLEPDEGALSSGDTGRGRMPEPETIAAAAQKILEGACAPVRDLEGVRAFVTAGGTHEPIDPVRFIGNHSTGRQGTALAQALLERGAEVTLFAANVSPDLIPSGIRVIATPAARDLYDSVMAEATNFQLGFFTAAVADFRPAEQLDRKMKKNASNADGWTLQMVRNPDVLAEVAKAFPNLTCFGFAAETGSDDEILAFGRAKASSKGAKYIAINRVGNGVGFGSPDNQVTVVNASGEQVLTATGTKLEVARELVSLVARDIEK